MPNSSWQHFHIFVQGVYGFEDSTCRADNCRRIHRGHIGITVTTPANFPTASVVL